MTFRGLRLMLSVIGLAAHSLAAPSNTPVSARSVTSNEDDDQQTMTAPKVRDALIELATSLMTANSRKVDVHHNGQNHHKPHQHQAISTLIHLLLTIGSAFAPLIGAIIGPLLTNVANGITWAISHTIASGFSPPHGLFSPELGHENEHKEHPTSYAAQGQPETGSGALEAQQPVDSSPAAELATVDDTRNEIKKA